MSKNLSRRRVMGWIGVSGAIAAMTAWWRLPTKEVAAVGAKSNAKIMEEIFSASGYTPAGRLFFTNPPRKIVTGEWEGSVYHD